MKTVTLHSLITPDKKIQAIKALRAATGMGLRESLQMCNDIMGAQGSACPSETGIPTPQTVGVYDDAWMPDLRANFVITEPAPDLGSNYGIDPNDVVELIFDALSQMDPFMAGAFRDSPSYQRIRPKIAIFGAPTA